MIIAFSLAERSDQRAPRLSEGVQPLPRSAFRVGLVRKNGYKRFYSSLVEK
jgi:hypothetical protein